MVTVMERALTFGLVLLAAGCRAPAPSPPVLAGPAVPASRLSEVPWVLPRRLSVHDAAAAAAGPLLLRPIEPTVPPTVTVGTCDPLLRELGRIQESLIAAVDPMLAGLESDLSDRFVVVLGEAGRAAVVRACPAAAKVLSSCHLRSETPCPVAPRVVAAGTVAVAIPDRATLGVQLACVADAALDRVTVAARTAAVQGARAIPARSWLEVLGRLSALAELVAVVEDLCVPRRRRVPPAVYEGARTALARIDAAVSAPAVGAGPAHFEAARGRVHVAGTGAFEVVVRLRPGAGSAVPLLEAATAAFETAVRDGVRCATAEPATAYGAVLPDGRVVPVYPESFDCAGLGPAVSAPRRATSRRPNHSAANE